MTTQPVHQPTGHQDPLAEDRGPMGRTRLPVGLGAAGLLLGLLACRPVIAIGWGELLILILLVAFLLGPAIFRLARLWNEFQESKKSKKD